MEAALAGVTCCTRGCNVLFGTRDASAHAHTASCGHSMCGNCARLFTDASDAAPLKCPVCAVARPTVLLNLGLSAFGDAQASGARAAEAAEAVEEHACVACMNTEGMTVAATHKCEVCPGRFFCVDDAVAHASKMKHSVAPLKAMTTAACGSHCDAHPGLPLDMVCVDCRAPLCAKCVLAEHKHHDVKGIDGVTDLLPELRSFMEHSRACCAAAVVALDAVGAARMQLSSTRERVLDMLSAAEREVHALVSAHFQHIVAVVDVELAERDKLLSDQERELSVTCSQLSAGVHVCSAALSSGSHVELARALRTSNLMQPLLKPFVGLAAPTDMDVVLDMSPLRAGLERVAHVTPCPVNASMSEVLSSTLPQCAHVDAAAFGGTGDDAEPQDVANTVKLIARGLAGNVVRLNEADVRLSVCDAAGESVGTYQVNIADDDSVMLTFDCDVDRPVLTLFVRGVVLKTWTSRRRLQCLDVMRTTVSGQGTQSFIEGNDGLTHNVITVTPMSTAGSTFIVATNHVSVSVRRVADNAEVGAVSVRATPAGQLEVVYTVSDADATEVLVTIVVHGFRVWHAAVPRAVRACIMGAHTRTLPVGAGPKYGMVVTPDSRFVVVSSNAEHKLQVYHCEAGGGFAVLHSIGSFGTGPLQFHYPARMCLAPTGCLLVCEYGNNRVQELSAPGEAVAVHVRFIAVQGPAWTIAAHGDWLAVGTHHATIELFSYSSGAAVRTIGSSGTGAGHIGSVCEGLRFTADGCAIIAAERTNKRVSVFSVHDGRFERHIGAGVVSHHSCCDIEISRNGEVLVADYGNHRVLVFRADDGTLVRSWGTSGTADGQFQAPTALAMANNKLFVLDYNSARVQVFE